MVSEWLRGPCVGLTLGRPKSGWGEGLTEDVIDKIGDYAVLVVKCPDSGKLRVMPWTPPFPVKNSRPAARCDCYRRTGGKVGFRQLNTSDTSSTCA